MESQSGSQSATQNHPISRVLILGAGSAGYLAALKFKVEFPEAAVQVIRSPKIPIIGVGESTTAAVPRFLHRQIGLDRGEFWREVRPSWKLGNKLNWGLTAERSHYYYSFDRCMDGQAASLNRTISFYTLIDFVDSSLFWVLMDRGKSPCFLTTDGHYFVNESGGYHIENRAFVAYLEQVLRRRGGEIIDADVAAAPRAPTGGIAHLVLDNGRKIAADLYVDCSGFASFLLGQTFGEPFKSYAHTLFCDRAVVGNYDRPGAVDPFTYSEALSSGWCWKIDFFNHVARGYVYSSQFISDDDAAREFHACHEGLGRDTRLIHFPCGRYERFWVHNVVAIGNSSAFMEPLESNAVHHLCEQLRFVCWALKDCRGRVTPRLQEIENRRFRLLWDDLRNFLAIHYKFNTRHDTPFWRHCADAVDLGDAAELVEYYREVGPTALAKSLIPAPSIFGFDGYFKIIVGQDLPTQFREQMTDADRAAWHQHRQALRGLAPRALPVREALERVYSPDWQWPPMAAPVGDQSLVASG